MNKQLIIIRGLPGTGKSTLAQKIIDSLKYSNVDRYIHAEADMFFVGDDGVYRFDPSKLDLAHISCQLSVNDGMENGIDCIIVSNTFTTADEIQPYLDLAEEYGYAVKVIRMTKEYGSIHGVPDKSMERMRRRMVDYAGELIHDYD